jgi:hypothetical protein
MRGRPSDVEPGYDVEDPEPRPAHPPGYAGSILPL